MLKLPVSLQHCQAWQECVLSKKGEIRLKRPTLSFHLPSTKTRVSPIHRLLQHVTINFAEISETRQAGSNKKCPFEKHLPSKPVKSRACSAGHTWFTGTL